jgi:hypothetical protein
MGLNGGKNFDELLVNEYQASGRVAPVTTGGYLRFTVHIEVTAKTG